jgi:carbon monoxide dehydrogenase subunit G
VNILDDENVQIRATQSVGPMTATFDAKVTVLERVPEELIRFRAAGRSVRGAIGNVRTDAAVKLRSIPAGTSVAVDSDVVLAGALGSVGQKVIARQASKVTAEFAANLQRALSGDAPPRPLAGLRAGPATRLRAARSCRSRPPPTPGAGSRPR